MLRYLAEERLIKETEKQQPVKQDENKESVMFPESRK